MGVSVLGPLEVDGQARQLGRRDRVVLAALVVAAGDPVSTESLADAVWGEALPASWAKVIQGCVVRLRKLLGSSAIESGDFGYRLALSEAELDCARFERGVQRAREALDGDDPERTAYLVSEALTLWRGRALADLEEWEPGRVRGEQLEGLRMDAEELLVEAQTSAGHVASVLEDARALVARAPFRERRWVLLATALHQSGRQAEALAAIQRARAMLADELGLDPGRELLELEVLLLRQDPSLAARPEREISRTCPYLGLLAFDAKDADSFFGRDEEVAAALSRLRKSSVLAVVGPSGVGKSSLVRAGVVATLLRGGQRVLVTTPGAHPRDSLEGLAPGGRQTLVVDQAEEAVTMCADPLERTAYFGALASHVEAGGPLVLSLRADYLADLAPFPGMARVLEDGLLLLVSMGEAELRRAIEAPALRVGLRLEPGLVDLLVRDVQGEPAALPLLSHVLRETWQRREGPTLTVAAYQGTGGVRHAVAQSAEALYEGLTDAQRERLRGLLLRLVAPSEEGDPVRARVSLTKVASDDQSAQLVEQLVAARLLTVDGDSVEIAHEALFREWPRLRGWLDDDVDGQRLFRHLTGAADAWDALGRPDSELYRGVRLTRALDWRDQHAPVLVATEQAFLDASLARNQSDERVAKARAAYQRVVNRRLRGALGAIAVLLVLAMLAGVAAFGAADRARRNQSQAEASAEVADARRAGAQALVTEDPATSLLLALAALQADGSAASRDTLGAALVRHPSLLTVRDTRTSATGISGSGDVTEYDSVASSEDGTFVAVSDALAGVRLFDASTLQPRDFSDRTPTNALKVSPDSSLLATAVLALPQEPEGNLRLEREPVRLYDMPAGTRAVHQLGGWPKGASVQDALAFSGDGRRIAAGIIQWRLGDRSPTEVLSVWDLGHREEPVFTVRLPEVQGVALSPDGRSVYAVVRGTRQAREYDVDTARLTQWAAPPLLSGAEAQAVAVSPDGSSLAVATPSHIVQLDTRTLRKRGPALTGHSADIADLDFSPEGTLLLSASIDGGVIVWESATGVQRSHLAPGTGSSAASFGPDENTVFTGTGQLMKWDLSGLGELYARSGSTTEHRHLNFSLAAPDGRTVARQRLGQLWFVDDRTGRATVPVSLPDGQTVHDWSRDGRWFLSKGEDDVLRVWNTRTGRLDVSRPEVQEGWPASFAATPDRIYLPENYAGTMRLLERATLTDLGGLSVGYDITGVLPDAATGTVLVFDRSQTVSRVDLSNRQVENLTGEGVLLTDGVVPALSPDGTRLMSIDADRQVRLMDLESGTWLAPVTRADWDSDFTFVYSPDGTQVASAGPDRIRLWDGVTGAYQASLPLPRRTPGASIAYLPDGSGLLVTTLEGSSWTVPTRISTWIARACATAGRNLTQAEWDQYFPGRSYREQCPQ